MTPGAGEVAGVPVRWRRLTGTSGSKLNRGDLRPSPARMELAFLPDVGGPFGSHPTTRRHITVRQAPPTHRAGDQGFVFCVVGA